MLLFLSVLPLIQAAASAVLPFSNPMLRGGSELTIAGNGVGEPMNVIISGLSSAPVLTDDGFLGWARAIGYDEECLDINLGAPQQANLGDGNGTLNQTAEFRASFNLPIIGTCLEGLTGGGHFRYWRQDGPLANTGALFLAVSQEEGLLTGQTIAPDGYNVGRDAFVAAASGSVSSGGITYTTIAQNITCLLLAGSSGINQGIAQDGIVTLLTVTIASESDELGC